MKATFLSRFTPSLMAQEALEALFVQREDLARRIIERIRDSALTPSKHHTLLVGPRGIGKTHFVSLIYHRIRAMDDLCDRLLIAWLREEEWGVTSFLDLLLRIFRALVGEYGEVLPAERIESLYGLQSAAAERAGAALLKEFVGNRTLLILVENLDDLFAGLGDKGQKRLRAYLQENPFCAILATSQSLFNGISLQTSPFYGFFRIHHLEELTLEDATRLLTNIANFEDDRELASFIQTPVGRARIRAVHHLAGGNHRVYVIFSQFLTRASLDEFVDPFMRTLDDLTPYYQARMAWLSPQQRKIVEFLCDRRHAVPVKEIAQRCFLTHQIVSSQLKTLRDMGYVHSESVGRESYYELREPLMRLCIEVKKNRGEPIRLLVDFLRLWYSRTELQQQLEGLRPDAALEREYVFHALGATEEDTEDLRVAACLRDYDIYIEAGEFSHALQVAEELIAVRGCIDDWFKKGYCLAKLERWNESLVLLDRLIELDPNDARIWNNRGGIFAKLGRWSEALVSFDRASEVDPNYGPAWNNRGVVLMALGRYDQALTSWNKVIELDRQSVEGWRQRGVAFLNLGDQEEALSSFQRAIEFDPQDTESWYQRGFLLFKLGRWNEALVSFSKVIELNPNNVMAWICRGVMRGGLGHWDEALTLFDEAIRLNPSNPIAWSCRGVALGNLKRWDEELASCDKAIEFGEQSAVVLFGRVEALLALNRWDEGCTALDDVLHRFISETSLVTAYTETIVCTLFVSSRDIAVWQVRIKRLLELYSVYSALSLLGQGLVGSISALTLPTVSDAVIRMWLNIWQELVGSRKEFELPLRLLDATVRYRETHDPRILLELPVEERKLLEPLLEQPQTASSSMQR